MAFNPNGKTTMEWFHSITEFHDAVAKIGNVHGSGAGAFEGYESFDQSLGNLLTGRMEVVGRADALLEKISGDSIQLESPKWDSSVCGAFVNVPAFLAGVPEAMMYQTHEQSDRSPIKVFASICVSGGLSQDDLEKRGIAILALCRKLTTVRPVELWIYADLGSYSGTAQIAVIRLETSPLDLCSTTYAMTAAGFLRHLCFNWGHPHGFDGAWAWRGEPRNEKYAAKLRKELGAAPEDLIIPGGYLYDPLITDPVGWINEKVAMYTGTLD